MSNGELYLYKIMFYIEDLKLLDYKDLMSITKNENKIDYAVLENIIKDKLIIKILYLCCSLYIEPNKVSENYLLAVCNKFINQNEKIETKLQFFRDSFDKKYNTPKLQEKLRENYIKPFNEKVAIRKGIAYAKEEGILKVERVDAKQIITSINTACSYYRKKFDFEIYIEVLDKYVINFINRIETKVQLYYIYTSVDPESLNENVVANKIKTKFNYFFNKKKTIIFINNNKTVIYSPDNIQSNALIISQDFLEDEYNYLKEKINDFIIA